MPSSESTLSLTNKCDSDSDNPAALHSSTSSSSLSKHSGEDLHKSKDTKKDDDRGNSSPTPSHNSDNRNNNYQVIVALGKGNSSLIEKNTGNLTDEKKQRRRAFAMLWFANEDWEG